MQARRGKGRERRAIGRFKSERARGEGGKQRADARKASETAAQELSSTRISCLIK